MAGDTLFRIASMTKPITSVAALMLLEEGKLSLDDPISRWAPEFTDMRVLRDAAGPLDDTDPAPREITIEDLMTHRAGLAYAFSSVGPIAHAYHAALGDVLSQPTDARRLDEGARRPAARLPAGRAVSLQPRHRCSGVSGRPYLGHGFSPVPLRANFPAARNDRHRLLHPAGKTRSGRGRLSTRTKPPTDWRPSSSPGMTRRRRSAAAAAGLISTADDYLKFGAHAAERRRGRRRTAAAARHGRVHADQSTHRRPAPDRLHGHSLLGRPGGSAWDFP